MFLIGTSTLAADTVWVVTIDTSFSTRYELPEPVVVGDDNGSGHIDMDDVIYKLDYIFSNGPAPLVGRSVDIMFAFIDSTQEIQENCETIKVLQHKIRGKHFGLVSEREWNDSL
jgi:hypothetical protein